ACGRGGVGRRRGSRRGCALRAATCSGKQAERQNRPSAGESAHFVKVEAVSEGSMRAQDEFSSDSHPFPPNCKPMRVLIVEDELKMAGLLRRGLVEEGHAADVAGTGEDAVWMAQAHEYEAIVLDVMLPGLTGF